MITVFTPTYNRAGMLPRLYESLKKQTFNDFEWLIADDGSSDGTRDLVAGWIKEQLFDIRYYYQENGGKHRAINKGAQLAKGEWFFIVDSDDYLPDNSIEIIEKQIKGIEENSKFAGVCGLKVGSNGQILGPGFSKDCFDEYPFRIDYRGDLAEVWKSAVLRNYPFPDFIGEKFCAECLVWFMIGQKYKVRYYNKAFYVGEYLVDGLSRNSFLYRKNSPNYTVLTNKEIMSLGCPWKRRIRAAVNYWRFIWYKKVSWNDLIMLPWFAYLFIPIGISFLVYDNYKYRNA